MFIAAPLRTTASAAINIKPGNFFYARNISPPNGFVYRTLLHNEAFKILIILISNTNQKK
jgi:hypothetical protein